MLCDTNLLIIYYYYYFKARKQDEETHTKHTHTEMKYYHLRRECNSTFILFFGAILMWWCDNEACGCQLYLLSLLFPFWLYRSFLTLVSLDALRERANDYYYYFSHITSFTPTIKIIIFVVLFLFVFLCVCVCVYVTWYANRVYNDGKMVRDITFMWCVYLTRVIYLMIWWICERACVKNGDLMMQKMGQDAKKYCELDIDLYVSMTTL